MWPRPIHSCSATRSRRGIGDSGGHRKRLQKGFTRRTESAEGGPTCFRIGDNRNGRRSSSGKALRIDARASPTLCAATATEILDRRQNCLVGLARSSLIQPPSDLRSLPPLPPWSLQPPSLSPSRHAPQVCLTAAWPSPGTRHFPKVPQPLRFQVWSQRRPIFTPFRYQSIAKATYLPKGHLRFHFVPVSVFSFSVTTLHPVKCAAYFTGAATS